MATKIQVNVLTGEQQTIALTEAEVAELGVLAASTQQNTQVELTPQQKLANLGLTPDDLKEILGL